MKRRTVGYIELEWMCPNCGTRNRGRVKSCTNCGAPQPENVQFERPVEETPLADAEARREAAAGADIHCPFCGTRNPGTAVTCSKCGGDLVEGRRRAAGREMAPAPIAPKLLTCTNCGTENPASNATCVKCGAPLPRLAPLAGPAVASAAGTQVAPKMANTRLLVGIAAGLALACAAAAFFLFVPTSSVPATVSDVYWQTSVPLQEMQTVAYVNERGSPPSDAFDVSCRTDSQEVCEQKTIDRGNGLAEVVEECRTETEQYCSYRREEWRTVQTYTEEGHDFSVLYAQPSLAFDQRLGDESVDYSVLFITEDGTKSYSPNDYEEFVQFDIGSTWTLRLNAVGGVMSVTN
jgi:ribosomal protein L40E